MLPVKPDIRWQLAAQLGVKYAVTKAAPELSGLPDPSDFSALRTVRDRFADAGFTLYALEGDEFDMSRIKLGLPGRDEDIGKYRKMLANMGRLGIRILCFNFMAGVGWFRSRNDLKERGGALTSGFDLADINNDVPLRITEEQLWNNLFYFLKHTPGTTPDGALTENSLLATAFDLCPYPATRNFGFAINIGF